MLALSFLRFLLIPVFTHVATLLVSVVLAVCMCVGNAFAADAVRITNLSNVTVSTWIIGDPTVIRTVLVCIYHQDLRTYGVTATGNGPGFFLNNAANQLAYSVTWNDGGVSNPGGGTTSPMTSGVKLTVRNNARITTDLPAASTNCNGGASPTAQLTITLTNTNLDAARDGTFTGILTLLLSIT